MKKPSKVLSMVLAVMMVMSSFAGLTGLNAKAAAYTPSTDISKQANLELPLITDDVILVDEQGEEVVGADLTVEDVIGDSEDFTFYKLNDKLEEEDLESDSSSAVATRNDMFALKFTKSAATSAFDIEEVRVYEGANHIDTLEIPVIDDAPGYGQDKVYTYVGETFNDLTGSAAMEYSFKFVVSAKTLDFSTILDKSFANIATVGLVDENSKLEYGKGFEFTITPAAGYAFNDLAVNKVVFGLYDKDGNVAVNEDEEEVLGGVAVEAERTGLYSFAIVAADVNEILDAYYASDVASEEGTYLAVSNEFDSNIVKNGNDYSETEVTKEVSGNGEITKVVGLTANAETKEEYLQPGTPVVLTAEPEEGYKLVDVTVEDSYTTANNLVSSEKAYVEVSKDGTTATIVFDADVREVANFTAPIKITPVFEQTATISVTNDGTIGVLASLSVNGEAVKQAKVNSNDDFELTLRLTEASKKAGSVLNPELKTTPLYVKTNAGTTTTAADVIVLNYDRTDENGNFVFKIKFNTSGSTFNTTLDGKVINFTSSTGNIYDATNLSSDTKYNSYAVSVGSTKAYFYFNDLNALGSAGTVEVFGKDANEEYNVDATGADLNVGEWYQVKITPPAEVIQPLLNVYRGSKAEELKFTTNYNEIETKVDSYTFEFQVAPAVLNGELTYDNFFEICFGERQSKYVAVKTTGEGTITLKDVNGAEWDMVALDDTLNAESETATVYIVPDKMENLESLTVYKITPTVVGDKKEEVKTTLNKGAYQVTLEKGSSADTKFEIVANFKEAVKSYPVINANPETDKDTNNGYLTLTLPELGQTEAYVGDEIKVTAVPNEGYILDEVLAYVGEAANGAIVEMVEDENAKGTCRGSFVVPENVTDYVKFVATFVKDETPVEPEYPTSNDWHKNEDGTWSFIDEQGQLLTGWQNNIKGWEGQWFYFDANGIMQTGWQTGIPGWKSAWFYFDPATGVMVTDWQNNIPGYVGKWFFFDNSTGEMYCNRWYQSWDGSWYYFGADGVMLTNAYTPDGYYVNADGVWVA